MTGEAIEDLAHLTRLDPDALRADRREHVRVIPPSPPEPPPATPPVMVVAIAAHGPDRLRIAANLGDDVSLLMVSSVEEALALLSGLPASRRAEPRVDDPQQDGPAASLAIDPDGRALVCGDLRIDLTPLEHEVMTCLLHDVGRMWSYEALHRRVWGSDVHRGRADVHSVVKRLRHKLTLVDSPLHLDVVRGVGLRLLPEREPRL